MAVWVDMDDLETGDTVTEDDMDAIRGNIEYLLDPNKQRILRDNSGTYSTTSTEFVDVDATNLAATITTYGGPVLVIVSANIGNSIAAYATMLDVDVDGTRIGADFAYGLVYEESHGAGVGYLANASFCVLVTGLEAGSHTFKLQWRVEGNTGYLQASTGRSPAGLTAIEL